jgi:SPP1 family predicted phage head-tail adaptor
LIVAGDLRERVAFLKATLSDDGYGNETPAWADYRTVWARVQQPLGREVVASGRLGEQATATVLVRDSSDMRAVTPGDALRFAGVVWNIRSGPVPMIKHRGFLEFLVERGVPVAGAE